MFAAELTCLNFARYCYAHKVVMLRLPCGPTQVQIPESEWTFTRALQQRHPLSVYDISYSSQNLCLCCICRVFLFPLLEASSICVCFVARIICSQLLHILRLDGKFYPPVLENTFS